MKLREKPFQWLFPPLIASGSLFAIVGSDVRKQWLKTPHSWLILSAILTWNQIIKNTKPGTEEYKKLSWYVHNTFTAISTADYYYSNLNEYDFDAINTQLFMVTSHLIQSMMLLFYIPASNFSEDEMGIIGEFLYLSQKEKL